MNKTGELSLQCDKTSNSNELEIRPKTYHASESCAAKVEHVARDWGRARADEFQTAAEHLVNLLEEELVPNAIFGNDATAEKQPIHLHKESASTAVFDGLSSLPSKCRGPVTQHLSRHACDWQSRITDHVHLYTHSSFRAAAARKIDNSAEIAG